MATLGLDVSDQYTNYCHLDSSGAVLEEGRLRTTESSLRKRFADFDGRVVLEAGTHSPWISRLFAEAGNEVVVANPRRVQLIAQSTRKNDKTDAETLARLGRVDPRAPDSCHSPKRAGSGRSRADSQSQCPDLGTNGAHQPRSWSSEVCGRPARQL